MGNNRQKNLQRLKSLENSGDFRYQGQLNGLVLERALNTTDRAPWAVTSCLVTRNLGLFPPHLWVGPWVCKRINSSPGLPITCSHEGKLQRPGPPIKALLRWSFTCKTNWIFAYKSFPAICSNPIQVSSEMFLRCGRKLRAAGAGTGKGQNASQENGFSCSYILPMKEI